MKRLVFTLSITLLLVMASITSSSAQSDYNTGIGIRFDGYENGLTIKHSQVQALQ